MRIQRVLLTIIICSGLWSAALSAALADGIATPSGPDGLTVEEALIHASQNRQELSAFRADFEAAGLKLKHAGLPPNPELGFEWDNLGGDLPADDVKESVVSLSQPLEIGGKPSARKNRVQAEILRMQCEQTTAWLDIAAEVRMAFLEVLGARERLALQNEAEEIAAELTAITHERVAAGELAATEETRAEAEKAATKAATQKLKRLLAEAELHLAMVLGEPESTTVTAAGQLPSEVAVPDRQTMLSGIQDSPVLALRRSETRLAASGLSLEQANAWADPALSLAFRDIPDKDASAVTIGLSIPLPLFQRNQSALAEAGAMAKKAAASEAATKHRLRTELIKAHTMLVAAEEEARTLRYGVLSRATEAAEAVREGFRYGKFRYSDVLEASRSQVEVKVRHLETILDLNRTAVALDRLLGKPAIPVILRDSLSSSLDRSNP